jgi:hypothetical protein
VLLKELDVLLEAVVQLRDSNGLRLHTRRSQTVRFSCYAQCVCAASAIRER